MRSLQSAWWTSSWMFIRLNSHQFLDVLETRLWSRKQCVRGSLELTLGINIGEAKDRNGVEQKKVEIWYSHIKGLSWIYRKIWSRNGLQTFPCLLETGGLVFIPLCLWIQGCREWLLLLSQKVHFLVLHMKYYVFCLLMHSSF